MTRKRRLQRSFNRRRSLPYRTRLQETAHAIVVRVNRYLTNRERKALRRHVRSRLGFQPQGWAAGTLWKAPEGPESHGEARNALPEPGDTFRPQNHP